MNATGLLLRSATSIRSMATAARNTTIGSDLFNYTSGRFLAPYAGKALDFCPNELSNVICAALKRDQTDLRSIDKFAEGGFNRIIKATFKDGFEILARLPFHMDAPLRHSVASEAATLTYLRAEGLPVPKVHGYSALSDNPVRTQYILLEKLEGRPLSDDWFSLPNKTLVKVMKQLVALEKKLLAIRLPASGSLYFSHDLPSESPGVSVLRLPQGEGEVVVGPSAAYAWWYRERAALETARGPWLDFKTCFEAVAQREIAFCNQYGKPRHDVEPSLRELCNFELQQPQHHAELLSDYLKLAPGLAINDDHRFARPTLRHPDLSPSNVLVNEEYDIVGLIDWQHTVILPLALCAGIPKHYQNWGDLVSETLERPETKLPDDFDTLDEDAQNEARETMRKRLVHFYYGALTLKLSGDHFDALRDENVMLRAKLYDRAAAPWEGNSLNLEHILIEVLRRWPLPIDREDPASNQNALEAPVQYDDQQIDACLKAIELQEEKEQELEEMREVIGIDSQGWVPNDDRLNHARQMREMIKQGLLKESTTEKERIAIRDHFSFDDHAE